MSLIKDVANYFLLNDRTLGRRERSLLDTILVRYRTLSEKADILEKLCITSPSKEPEKIVKRMEDLRKDLDREVKRIIGDLGELILKERIEFEKDINEPSDALKKIFSTLNFYLDYIQKDTEVSSGTLDKLKALIADFQKEYEQVLSIVDGKIIEVKEIFEREINRQGSAYSLASKKLNEIAAAGDQWEREKIALSQKVRSVLRKLAQIEKELQRIIKKHYQGKDSSKELTQLVLLQQQHLTRALDLLLAAGKSPLNNSTKYKVRDYITLALSQELLFLSKLFAYNVPQKIIDLSSNSLGAEKKNLLRLANKLAYQKTEKLRVYPLEFWLGEQRALGYLHANDEKNLNWLKELLKEGLLEAQTGMLSERLTAIKELSARGILVSIHSQYIEHFSEIKTRFEEIITFVSGRAELAKRVFGIIGAAMYDLGKILLDAQNKIDAALHSFEEKSAKVPFGTKKIGYLRLIRGRQASDTAREEKELDKVRGQVVAEMTTLHGEVRRSKKKLGLSLGGLMSKAAVVALSLVTLGGSVALSANSDRRVETFATSGTGHTQQLSFSQVEELKKKSGEWSDVLHHLTPAPVEDKTVDLDQSISDKFEQGGSPVEILYRFNDQEMLSLWNKGRAGIAWTLTKFGISGVERMGELSTEAERLYHKFKGGGKLEEREVQYLRNYYYLIAIGGKFKGMDESSQLLIHYLTGKGVDMDLDSSIYKDSEVVQAAQKSMLEYIRNQYHNGRISKKGTIGSDEVFKGQKPHPFSGGYGRSGGLAKGEPGDSKIYLIAEQNNQALKNTNNRFILIADYSISGDQIYVNWRIDDDYSFEENRGYVTEIPIPGSGGQVLKISDAMSAALVYMGAKKFNHHTHWSSVDNFS